MYEAINRLDKSHQVPAFNTYRLSAPAFLTDYLVNAYTTHILRTFIASSLKVLGKEPGKSIRAVEVQWFNGKSITYPVDPEETEYVLEIEE